MASPFTAYFAGMGTVVAALAIGFSTAVMLTSPLPEQKEQPAAFEKRAAKPEKPAEPAPVAHAPPPAERRLDAAVSPLITAIETPTTFGASSVAAPPPPAIPQSATQTAAQEPPGVLQPPVRPAAPVEAAAPAARLVTPSREVARQDRVQERVVEPATAGSGEWRKKEKRDTAQKKARKPIEEEVVETRSTTGSGYAPERAPAPLGIFNLLLGTGN